MTNAADLHTSQVNQTSYLNGGRWALFSGSGGRQRCGGLDEGGGHLRWHGGGGARGAPAGGHVPHQPHAAINLDVGMTFSCHVENLQAVVIEPRKLALIRALAVIAAYRDGGLGVKNGQLTTWGKEQRGKTKSERLAFALDSLTSRPD